MLSAEEDKLGALEDVSRTQTLIKKITLTSSWLTVAGPRGTILPPGAGQMGPLPRRRQTPDDFHAANPLIERLKCLLHACKMGLCGNKWYTEPNQTSVSFYKKLGASDSPYLLLVSVSSFSFLLFFLQDIFRLKYLVRLMLPGSLSFGL